MADKNYHIKTDDEMREEALLDTGHRDKEMDPETINFASKCPRCGFINDRSDIIDQPNRLTAVYRCRNCGENFADFFGVSL